MKLKAGERIKGLRELMGLSRTEFGELVGIEPARIRNIELQRTKVNEDDFAALGLTMPELLPWLTYEADISFEDMLQSQNKLLRLIAARIEAGQVPEGHYLDHFIRKTG